MAGKVVAHAAPTAPLVQRPAEEPRHGDGLQHVARLAVEALCQPCYRLRVPAIVPQPPAMIAIRTAQDASFSVRPQTSTRKRTIFRGSQTGLPRRRVT